MRITKIRFLSSPPLLRNLKPYPFYFVAFLFSLLLFFLLLHLPFDSQVLWIHPRHPPTSRSAASAGCFAGPDIRPMAWVVNAVFEVLRKPTVCGAVTELLLLVSPLWIAVLVGLVLGWAWRPRWAAEVIAGGGSGAVRAVDEEGSSSRPPSSADSGPGLGFWKPQLPSRLVSFLSDRSWSFPSDGGAEAVVASSPFPKSKNLAVTEKDLMHLIHLVENTDGGPQWLHMMDRSLPNMTYQAWRRDPETGPPQYRSRTIFEDATPEMVRDLFWDDAFRLSNKWDDMLIHHETLEECSVTGTMVVQWIRKFPFFCSDREYSIGRRIWKLGSSYYCITKGVPWPYLPRRNKPRRVDLYYSSWCIRQVESKRDPGQLTACEVMLFHQEDMGIPWEIAKLGVRQGMWGYVKRIEPGLRAYQTSRMADEPLSSSALMAQINTKITYDYIKSLEERTSAAADIVEEAEKATPWTRRIPKFLVVGGAVALTCTLDRGLLTKAVIFGVARRLIRTGKKS